MMMDELLRAGFARLTARERFIIGARFLGEPVTLQRVAEWQGVTRSRMIRAELMKLIEGGNR